VQLNNPRISSEEELDRLAALYSLNILDSEASEACDRICRLAQAYFDFPVVAVSFFDSEREYFKAAIGLEKNVIPRQSSVMDFMLNTASLLESTDASQDVNFAHHPLVHQAPFVRAYYAAPIFSPERYIVGALSIMDVRAGSLSQSQVGMLQELADMVSRELEHHAMEMQHTSLERRFLENTRRHKKSLAFAQVGTWSWNVNSGEVFWSDQVAILFGHTTAIKEIHYQQFLDSIYPADKEKVTSAINRCLEFNEPYDVEHRIIWPNDEIRWVQNKGDVQRDKAGQPEWMLGVVVDIDDRKCLEEELLEKQQQFQSLFELSPIGIALNTLEGRFVKANGSLQEMLGYSEEELKGLSHFELTPSCYAEQEATQLESLNVLGRYGPYEKQYIHKQGYVIDVRLNGALVHGRDGTPYIWSLVEDISFSKQVKEEMERVNQQLFEAQNLAKLGHWEANMATGELYWSVTIYDIFGLDRTQFVPNVEAFKQAIHPEDLTQVELSEQKARETGVHDVVHRIIRPDGDIRYVHEVARLKPGTQHILMGTVQDVTKLKRIERSLEVFQRVFDASQQGLGITDRQGRLIYTNQAHDRLHGYERGELSGAHIAQFFSQETAKEVFKQVEVCIDEKTSWSGLIPIVRKDGAEVVTAANINFVTDAHGEVEYIFNIMSDYAPELHRQEQLRAAKEEAERASQAKSEFLSSMSHELRTPMNAVLGFAQLLNYDDSLQAGQKEAVEEILKAGYHLLGLINEVLDLAKIESGSVELSMDGIQLKELVEQSVEWVSAIARQAQVDLQMAEFEGCCVYADAKRLKQVLLNLLSNAIKYNRAGGVVEVSVEKQENRVCIVVQDNGMGMDEDQMNQLFQPFSRLGHEGSVIEGTGVGLTISKTLIELMGGSIGASSEQGKGSTFWVELPVSEGKWSEMAG
jgi:PAS domain S-box-containing protein